jgi:hypothetical protein
MSLPLHFSFLKFSAHPNIYHTRNDTLHNKTRREYMGESRMPTRSAGISKNLSRRPDLVVRLNIPTAYLSTLSTTSMAPMRPTSNTLPLRAPIASVTNRLYPWDQVPSTLSQAPMSWLDLNMQKPLTRAGAESLLQPAQQENVRTYEVRKVEEDSQDLVPGKGEPEPPLRAIKGALEILAYSREPWAYFAHNQSQNSLQNPSNTPAIEQGQNRKQTQVPKLPKTKVPEGKWN